MIFGFYIILNKYSLHKNMTVTYGETMRVWWPG